MRLFLAILFLALSSVAIGQEAVTVYSHRQPGLIAPLLEAFTKESGYRVNVLFMSKGLIERVRAEGANSPADVFLTTDIGNLIALKEAGITQRTDLEALRAHIPAQYRDAAGHWYGLTQRGRVFYVSKDLENPPQTYEDLANPAYAGLICLRDGHHAYNNALFASFIANLGEEAARDLLIGIRDNLARRPAGNDRAQAKGIYSGECQIGIGNSYYIGLMLTNAEEPEQQDWAQALSIVLPNTDGRGTHMNISGMAMAAHAPNTEGAQALMEFLASKTAQEIYAEIVFEYPVSPQAQVSELVARFGVIRPDTLPLIHIAENRARAAEIIDEIGFNNSP